jgi:hypothetical protein
MSDVENANTPKHKPWSTSHTHQREWVWSGCPTNSHMADFQRGARIIRIAAADAIPILPMAGRCTRYIADH